MSALEYIKWITYKSPYSCKYVNINRINVPANCQRWHLIPFYNWLKLRARCGVFWLVCPPTVHLLVALQLNSISVFAAQSQLINSGHRRSAAVSAVVSAAAAAVIGAARINANVKAIIAWPWRLWYGRMGRGKHHLQSSGSRPGCRGHNSKHLTGRHTHKYTCPYFYVCIYLPLCVCVC